MKNENKLERTLGALSRYLTFFLLVATVTSASTALFVFVLSNTLDISLTAEELGPAAKLTFINVVIMGALFAAADALRRRLTVKRPIARITEAAERISRGEHSVRLPADDMPGGDTFREIAESFNRMASELEGVEALRTDFTANVSHELKTPLAVMQNYGTLLSAPQLDDSLRLEYARGIVDTSKKAADMVSNILRLDRLEHQQIFPNTSRYDLGEQLCEILLQYESVWESKNIDISAKLEENVMINADSELLLPVWSNLLSNAFKFTPEGGSVSVELSADEQYATVRIGDTGCGMSSEVGAHIFEKFYQGDTSHATGGNGLGLALVKRVIDIIHGEISVESTEGIGSVFTVRLAKDPFGDRTR